MFFKKTNVELPSFSRERERVVALPHLSLAV
jgi:hypothetical protein